MLSIRAAVTLGITALVTSTPSLADVVVLDNGSEIEGKAVEKDGVVEIELPSGKIVVDAKRVVRIIRQEAPVERVARYRESLAKEDAEGHFRLAGWAEEKGLEKERRDLLERTIAIDPDHAAARKALGFFEHEGRWVTEDEYMAIQGYVREEDGWISRDDKTRLEIERAVEIERARADAEFGRLKNAAEARERELLAGIQFLEGKVVALEEELRRRPTVIYRYIPCPTPVQVDPNAPHVHH